MAAGFFAGRRYADLAIGSDTQVAFDPEPDASEGDRRGAVHVLYGSPQGLTMKGNQLWRANTNGIKGEAGEDYFGSHLAAGNLGKDRNGWAADDLIIGAPANHDSRGAVHIIYGSRTGLTSRGDQVWRQSSRGIPGVAEGEAHFGARVVAADFGNNPVSQRYADLAVSATGQSLGGVAAGTVHVLAGSSEGLGPRTVQLWREDQLGGRLVNHVHSPIGGFGALLAGH